MVAGVVVWKDNAVLLIQRGKTTKRGWNLSLLGGRQELGETTREAGVREVREETGLEVDIKDLIDVVATIHRDDEGHAHMQYTLVDYYGMGIGRTGGWNRRGGCPLGQPRRFARIQLVGRNPAHHRPFGKNALALVIYHLTSGGRPKACM